MITCEAMTDRMPEVASGASAWTAEEAAHLAGCTECRAEWKLIELARRLGAGAAAGLDSARTATLVLARLASERRVVRWRRTGLGVALATAAALLLVVWTGWPRPMSTSTPTPVAGGVTEGFRIPVAELDSLDANQLESVLEDLDAPLEEGRLTGAPPMGELDDVQLERVLRSLEG
jgi:hypothetical protein